MKIRNTDGDLVHVDVIQSNAAAAAFNRLDLCSTIRRGANGCSATTNSATTTADTVFRAVIRRLFHVRHSQPGTDIHRDGVGRRSAGHVAH